MRNPLLCIISTRSINTVYKKERKPFKITFDMTVIFETPRTNMTSPTTSTKSIRSMQLTTRTWTRFLRRSSTTSNLSCLTTQQLNRMWSSSMPLPLPSWYQDLSRSLVKVKLPDEFVKSKLLITDNDDDGLCWYNFLSVCLKHIEYMQKLVNIII